MTYNLNDNELSKLKSLIKNNINIYKLYTILYKLEIDGKKESEEYKKHLDNLSIYIEIENKIYNELKQNTQTLLEIINFIFNNVEKDIRDQKEILIHQEYNIPILIRILKNSLSLIIQNPNELKKLSENQRKKIISIMRISSNTITKENTPNIIPLQNIIEKDILYSFLAFLENHIKDSAYISQREILKLAKYNTIFLNKDIELYALTSSFTFPTTPYIYSKAYRDLHSIDIKTYNKIKNTIAHNIVSTEIYELLEIEDIDYNDKNKVTTSILRQCMIKSAFLQMTDEEISDVNYEFHEYIEDKEYEEIHPNSKISENIIIYLFKNIKKDKNKTKTISLKY